MMLRSLAILGCTFGAGMAAMTLVRREALARPVVLTPPPVDVHVAAPSVSVTAPTPAPAAPAQPAPPPAPPPKATSPFVNAACVVPTGTDLPECAWDAGFPAISPDGKTIALEVHPDEGPASYGSLSIRFIDVATSKIVREDAILKGGEAEPVAAAQAPGTDAAVLEKATSDLLGKVYKRVAAVQPRLAHYRTLDSLGGGRGDAGDPDAPKPTTTYAEVAYGAIRIVDPSAGKVLWQGDVDATPADANKYADGDLCHGASLWRSDVWWDAQTHTVLVDQDFHTGGCMCPTFHAQAVVRF